MGRRWVVAELALRTALAQQLPALVELSLEVAQALCNRRRLRARRADVVLFFDQS